MMKRFGRVSNELGFRTRAVTVCPGTSQPVVLIEWLDWEARIPLFNASSATSLPVRPLAPIMRTCILG